MNKEQTSEVNEYGLPLKCPCQENCCDDPQVFCPGPCGSPFCDEYCSYGYETCCDSCGASCACDE